MTATRYAYNTATTVQIVAIWCSGCGLPYGLPEGFIAARREDHQTWTCPNGCVRHFPVGTSEAEKLRKENDRLRVRANGEEARRRLAERQRAAAKGQVTRIKNRVGNGVCPCCNRTFQNLARHIAGQHPDFTGDPK